MLNLAILVSGGGTNLQAILDNIDNKTITNARVSLVVASKPDIYALERAKKHNIKTEIIRRKDFGHGDLFGEKILEILKRQNIDLVVLAGYLSILPPNVINAFPNKIINIHPALIPAFCGKGFYGLEVHKAVIKSGVKVSGATVHFVNNDVDGGAIILQKAVNVEVDDTPESLQKKVMEQAEWLILPQAIEAIANNKLIFKGNKVFISNR